MYTVIHSTDPYLLARMATDLQCEGFINDKEWNEIDWHVGDWDNQYLAVDHYEEEVRNMLTFFSIECGGNPTRYTLTSRNYLSILKKILDAHYHNSRKLRHS